MLVKNKIEVGNDVEIIGKNTNRDYVQKIGEMFNHEMEPIKEANPGQRVFIIPERPVEKYFIIRRKVESSPQGSRNKIQLHQPVKKQMGRKRKA